jgi:hypothetical protein
LTKQTCSWHLNLCLWLLQQWHQQKLRVFDCYSADLPQKCNISTGNHRWSTFCHDLKDKPSSLSDAFILADMDYYPNIREIFHILLTMPIGSIPCERSFSALMRLKQRNRTTMVENRLNGLALLHIHRDVNVDRVKILDEFDTCNRWIGTCKLLCWHLLVYYYVQT